jgi:hypothetical protein
MVTAEGLKVSLAVASTVPAEPVVVFEGLEGVDVLLQAKCRNARRAQTKQNKDVKILFMSVLLEIANKTHSNNVYWFGVKKVTRGLSYHVRQIAVPLTETL